MCCEVILCKYKNYSIMAMQSCQSIYTGANGKWFGFSEFYRIPQIIQLVVMQLAGIYFIYEKIFNKFYIVQNTYVLEYHLLGDSGSDFLDSLLGFQR